MEHEWSPEPSTEEREALEQALERLLNIAPEPRGAWWREGVRENLLHPELVRLEHEPGGEALAAQEP